MKLFLFAVGGTILVLAIVITLVIVVVILLSSRKTGGNRKPPVTPPVAPAGATPATRTATTTKKAEPYPWYGVVSAIALVVIALVLLCGNRTSPTVATPKSAPTWGDITVLQLSQKPVVVNWLAGAVQVRVNLLSPPDGPPRKYQIESGDRKFVRDGSGTDFGPYPDTPLKFVSVDGQPLDITIQWRK